MNEIYVTGHRNPDTDAIVAAMAYANLRHALGDREYTAVRIGAVNDETQRLLERFHFEAPPLIHNMNTQVRDLDYDRPPALTASVTIDFAWRTINEGRLDSIPIVKEDGTLHGMLSTGDIADYNMRTINDHRIDALPLFNLVSVLEGKLVNEFYVETDTVSGEVQLALPQNFDDPALSSPDRILICGNQPEEIERAIRSGVHCVILCRADLKPEWAECDTGTCIVSTPMSARNVSRLLYQALPVARICHDTDIVSFHLTDYLDDVRETLLKSRYRSYPILDESDRVVGSLARFHLLRPNRKRLVLVDHNEAAQSVPGLEQAEILEIIDHHRLADIQTAQPIRVRNEPVGSTNTILASMYQENGVVPSPSMAGLMAGAILSDTVLFKSPTCTKRDIAMAERLARVAQVSLEELGKSLFSSAGDDKSAREIFKTDYKEFHISGQNIAVSQITCGDSSQLLARSDEFLAEMRTVYEEESFDMVLLMITDVLLEGTHLLYIGDDDVIQQAFSSTPQDNRLFLPGVMSRKKQIIPMLTALWG
ncbi:MAG: putative manganese-dependent inorganic diphosphatase [Oscillospiraceae bacterium]|nr:putative manganese-dependent inorganic diphosphatase [Oscillospiraceae bacterium]